MGDLHVQDDAPIQGEPTLQNLIAQSSRIGAARMGLLLPADKYVGVLTSLGIGFENVLYPHAIENANQPIRYNTRPESQVLLALAPDGGGVTVSLLQLAQAYLSLAGDGAARIAWIHPGQQWAALPKPVFRPETAQAVRKMLGGVVSNGNAPQAKVEGLPTGGKTGTIISLRHRDISEAPARETEGQPPSPNRHTGLFVGMAPLATPQYVVAVMLERDGGEVMPGGKVAAPVFARIVTKLQKLPISARH